MFEGHPATHKEILNITIFFSNRSARRTYSRSRRTFSRTWCWTTTGSQNSVPWTTRSRSAGQFHLHGRLRCGSHQETQRPLLEKDHRAHLRKAAITVPGLRQGIRLCCHVLRRTDAYGISRSSQGFLQPRPIQHPLPPLHDCR
jgi:hypothetical protein